MMLLVVANATKQTTTHTNDPSQTKGAPLVGFSQKGHGEMYLHTYKQLGYSHTRQKVVGVEEYATMRTATQEATFKLRKIA